MEILLSGVTFQVRDEEVGFRVRMYLFWGLQQILCSLGFRDSTLGFGGVC